MRLPMIPIYGFILFPILMALIIYIGHFKRSYIFVLIGQGFLFLESILLFARVHTNGSLETILGGYEKGLGISLKVDLVSAILVVLTTFLFLSLLLYNYHKPYMNSLFMFLFLVLQGLLCGLFVSNDFFNIYVLVEVSTITVSILIIFKKDSISIYDGIIYLFTNLASMTFFLLGIGYLYKIFGTLDMTLIKEEIPHLSSPRILLLPFALMVTSVDLKSAIMPLFSWLPKAHGTASAPSIVSAVLSGLYVKGGVYLFIRISDVFSPVIDAHMLFLFLGFTTAVIGFVFALSQTDLKLILAYHTVSQIGLIVFGFSIGSTYSHWGAVYHIMNHAIFKTTLFLTAGIIIDEYHERNISKIRGVFKRMPIVGLATLVAVLGITGAPLFNGSFSKYLIEKGVQGSLFFEIGLFIINLGTVLSFVKYSQIFFGADEKDTPFPIRWNQSLVIMTLAILCFLGGILGPFIADFLFEIHVNLSPLAYLQKIMLYLFNIGLGLIFYFYAYPKLSFFKKIRELELSFNQIIIAIVLFFTVFLGALSALPIF